nr:unnamed protein product [Spirometra erinaceieuropaei]
MRLKIIGLIGKSHFHAACFCAKDLHETLPKVFDEPKIKGVYEFEWIEYLRAKKKELKGEYWAFDGVVICFCDKKPIGNCEALRDWASSNYGLDEYRPYTFYEMLAHDAYRDELVRRDRIYVSMVITIGGRACGTLLFEISYQKRAKTLRHYAEET